jgi:hypothetical protein
MLADNRRLLVRDKIFHHSGPSKEQRL